MRNAELNGGTPAPDWDESDKIEVRAMGIFLALSAMPIAG